MGAKRTFLIELVVLEIEKSQSDSARRQKGGGDGNRRGEGKW